MPFHSHIYVYFSQKQIFKKRAILKMIQTFVIPLLVQRCPSAWNYLKLYFNIKNIKNITLVRYL